MGFVLSKRQEQERAAHIEARQRQVASIDAKRMALAEKIAMMVVDKINTEIIRPGPKPEERECYVVAQELHDMKPALAKLIADIVNQEGAP